MVQPATPGNESTPSPTQLVISNDAAPAQGLAVRVEKLQLTTGTIDPSQVALLAPFPAKPLAPTPAGWCLKTSPNAPPFTREVELSPGCKITLNVRPHLLVPDPSIAATFDISEPGFIATLGYQQKSTVTAILSHSINELESDALILGSTIDQLQQILVSLPKEEPILKAEPAPISKSTGKFAPKPIFKANSKLEPSPKR